MNELCVATMDGGASCNEPAAHRWAGKAPFCCRHFDAFAAAMFGLKDAVAEGHHRRLVQILRSSSDSMAETLEGANCEEYALAEFRISWRRDGIRSDLSLGSYDTVTEAKAAAERMQNAFVRPELAGCYDIVWAESGRAIPDWFRQASLEKGR